LDEVVNPLNLLPTFIVEESVQYRRSGDLLEVYHFVIREKRSADKYD
jgi:hypothetical protein